LTERVETTTVRRYLEILRRRRWVIIESAVAITAIVVLVSLLQPTEYTAKARVMAVSQSPSLSVVVGTNVDLSKPDERELATLASFVVTPEIAKRVDEELGWRDSPSALLADTTAEADPNADVIVISAQRSDPEQAAQLANAFAGQFVQWRKEDQQGSFDEAIDLVEQRIGRTAPGSAERKALTDQRSQLEVYRALVTGGLTIGETAEAPDSPSSPKPFRDGALALAAGLVLGIGLAFMRESLDVKLHSADEIAERTTLPVIAAIPELRKGEKSADRLTVLHDPRGPIAEAYRFLRTNLEFVDIDRDARVIMVTSPLPEQGKSTTIANLALAFVRAGKSVTLVEGDLRRPSLHRFFHINDTRGVTSVVAGTTSLEDALQVLTFRDQSAPVTTLADIAAQVDAHTEKADAHTGSDLVLRVLPSGALPPNPGEIVGSRQLATILRKLRDTCDYVLVDAPPMFAVGDATALAASVDGVIVIVRLGQTTADTVKDVEDFFDRVPARSLGIVVTGVSGEARGKYYRYEKYYG